MERELFRLERELFRLEREPFPSITVEREPFRRAAVRHAISFR
jgi:hypothetical protein